jgi:hypothetical protein
MTPSATPTPTPTPTPSKCHGCDPAYTWSPLNDDECYAIITTGGTASTNPYTAQTVSSEVYTDYGTKIYNTSSFPLHGSGTTDQYSLIRTENVWRRTQGGSLEDGPLNRCSIWTTETGGTYLPTNKWIGFSDCLSGLTEGKTYYVGLAGDNHVRFSSDTSGLIVDTNTNGSPYNEAGNDQAVFKYWHVYPVVIGSGNHNLTVYGLNENGIAGFGCEIYDNTFDELTGATSINDLTIIFSTSGQTEFDIVQDTNGDFLSEGYVCPSGYTYSSCSGQCEKTIVCNTVPSPTPTPSITTTPTPTQSITPTNTPTITQTTTVTPTNTLTPSNSTTPGVTSTPTLTITPTQTPSVTTTITPTTTPTPTNSIISEQTFNLKEVCGSITGALPQYSNFELTGTLPTTGQTVAIGDKCYEVISATTATPTFTFSNPTIYNNAEACKTDIGEICRTNVLQGCSTSNYYQIFDNSDAEYITLETGTTVQITMDNLFTGDLPENCFTAVYGDATVFIIGDLVTSATTTCSDPSCAVTPTPTPTNSTTPDVTPSITVTPSTTASISLTPTPTKTPVSVTPSPTMTVTPSVTSSNPTCEDFEFEVTVTPIQPSPSITPSVTPTPSIYRNDSGDTVVFVIDSGYFECNGVIRVSVCDSDINEEYFVNGPLFYNGTILEVGDIFTAEINGKNKCMTYEEDLNGGSSTAFINNITEIHNICCETSPSPTPTPTNTPSITPTPSPSTSVAERTGVVYVYTSCTTNNMFVQTEEVPDVLSGQTFIYNSGCWSYVGYFTTPYRQSEGYRRTDYSGNYFGNPSSNNIFDDCTDCLSSDNRFVTPTVTPTSTPSDTPTPSITPSITTTPSITPTPTPTPNQDIDLEFDVDYRSGSTIATFTVVASEVLVDSLRVTFKNVLFNTSTQRDVELTATVDIPAGSISATTSASTVTDYADIQPYQTSYKDIKTTSSGVTVRNIDKYHRVNFIGKTTPITSFYQFTDCCNTGGTKNLEVDRTSPWITDGYGVIIDGVCYIPRALGGDGSDGLYYGPDFKDCSFSECQTCPSPTPSITPTITPTVTPSITPTVTPSNPYYLACEVNTIEYNLQCVADTIEYILSCNSVFVTPSVSVTPSNTPTYSVTPSNTPTYSVTPSITPSVDIPVATPTETPSQTVTPSISPTPSITPSLTSGDKTIYVYYPNI